MYMEPLPFSSFEYRYLISETVNEFIKHHKFINLLQVNFKLVRTQNVKYNFHLFETRVRFVCSDNSFMLDLKFWFLLNEKRNKCQFFYYYDIVRGSVP